MNKKYLLFILIGSLLFLISCSKVKDALNLAPSTTDITNSESQLTEAEKAEILNANLAGETALKSGKIDVAMQQYTIVLSKSPYDPTANFVMTIGEFLKIVENPKTKEIIENYNKKTGASVSLPTSLSQLSQTMGKSTTQGFKSMSTTKTTYLSTSSTNQSNQEYMFLQLVGAIPTLNATTEALTQFIEEVLIPSMQSAENHLDILFARPDNFSYVLKKDVTRLEQDIIIDKAELYTLYALLKFYEGILHQEIVYSCELNPNIDPSTAFNDIVSFLNANPNFGKIRSTGKEHMKSALNCYIAVVDSTKSAITYLQSETGDLTNHPIKPFTDPAQAANLIAGLDQAKLYLSGTPIEIPIKSPTTNQVIKTLKINIAAYYLNPIEDIREYVNSNVVIGKDAQSSKFPSGFDFTIHGLFPDLQSETDWRDMITAAISAYSYTTVQVITDEAAYPTSYDY